MGLGPASLIAAVTLSLLAALAAGGCAGRTAPFHSTATETHPAAKTEIILLGTIHDWHSSNAKYSVAVLQNIIVGLKPAMILVELPPTIGGQATVADGRIVERFPGNENTAANAAAAILRVEVLPYDREGRNEFYQQTHYFARQKEAYTRIRTWAEAEARKDSESPQVLTTRVLYANLVASQGELMNRAPPEMINSTAFDGIIVTKHCIDYRLWPQMLAASGEESLAKEFLFFRDEWEERNTIMAGNIVEIARKHAGEWLVVLCGAEHRYKLRELLAKAAEVTVKEFYQVPEWAATGAR